MQKEVHDRVPQGHDCAPFKRTKNKIGRGYTHGHDPHMHGRSPCTDYAGIVDKHHSKATLTSKHHFLPNSTIYHNFSNV